MKTITTENHQNRTSFIVKMTYQQALRQLFDFNQKTAMGANAVTLYVALLEHYFSKKEVIISDYELSKTLAMARQTVINTKNKLKMWGFIDFSAEKGKASIYTFLFLGKRLKVEQIFEKTENHPSLEAFLTYAQSQQGYIPVFDKSIKEKYQTWEANNWENVHNWQQELIDLIILLVQKDKIKRALLPKINRLVLP